MIYESQEQDAGVEQLKIIHTVPNMTDTERDVAQKRVSNDLYEVFSRIHERLNLDNDK